MVESNIYDIDSIINYHLNTFVRYTTIPREDLFQVAYIGYLRAVANADRRITYQYVSTYIKDELRRALKKQLKHDKSHISVDMDVMAELKDLQEPNTNPTASEELHYLESLLQFIPRREREIVKAMYFDPQPRTLRELAKERGVSKTQIHSLKEQGLAVLKRLYAKHIGD